MPPVSESPHIGQAHSMSIGIGVFVVALGAVLAFAVDWSIGGLDLKDVGWFFMIAGVVGLILLSALWKRRLEAEAVASTRRRQVADVPPAYDDPTPPPPATMTAVASEPVTPMTPRLPRRRRKVGHRTDEKASLSEISPRQVSK
jgi:hypothetical protein